MSATGPAELAAVQHLAAVILTQTEIEQLTGYRRASLQLKHLHAQGFWRARISKLGNVILEREHYQAVCRGDTAANDPKRPQLRPVPRLLRQA